MMNMTQTLSERFPDLAPLPTAAADYDVVRRAIAHIRGNWRSQPEIETIADAAGVSATDLHHLFRRWCGLTPKAFLQALTLNSARELLRSSASVLDASYEVGLSGPGRLHDLFVTHEAMSPGEWKAGGEGLDHHLWLPPVAVRHGAGDDDTAGLAGLALADAGKEKRAAQATCARAGRARVTSRTLRRRRQPRGASSIPPCGARISRLRVVLIGTDFEVRVWEKLLDIPMGKLDTYSGIAAKVGDRRPRARSARPSARTRSAFVVPCHRVVGKNGDITGYHWGITRKRAMLGWEAGKVAA